MKASVIIPNLNGAGWLRDSIESVWAQTEQDFELIVIDNGSTDESLDIARSYCGRDRYTLIENAGNTGFSHAVNQGIAIAKGEYMALFNNDAFAEPDWLAELIRAAETAEKAVDQTAERADAAPADVKEVGLSIHDERGNMAEEAKTVAVKSTQDLISFSLGAPRDGADVEVDAPESMEIKSTKQVAKAVPVETPSDEAEPLIPPSDAMGSMDADEAAARVDEGVHLREVDVPGFHDAEVRADVEAPDVTSDSLGTGLEAILARRSA